MTHRRAPRDPEQFRAQLRIRRALSASRPEALAAFRHTPLTGVTDVRATYLEAG